MSSPTITPTMPGTSPVPSIPFDVQPLTTISVEDQAKRATAAGAAYSWAPQDFAALSRLSLEQLIEVFRARLMALEAVSAVTGAQMSALDSLFTARHHGVETGTDVPAPTPGGVTVYSVLHGALTAPSPNPTESFFTDALSWVATAGAGIIGTTLGGPAGGALATALVGELIHTW